MELIRAFSVPLVAARDLRRYVGRAVRRLQDRARLALPTENALLGDLGGRFGTFEEFLSAAGRERDRLPIADLARPWASAYLEERHPERRSRVGFAGPLRGPAAGARGGFRRGGGREDSVGAVPVPAPAAPGPGALAQRRPPLLRGVPRAGAR